MFLAISRKTIIDTPANNGVDPPIVEVSHQEMNNAYIERESEQVAKNLSAALEIEYYEINDNGTLVTLKKVSVKTGSRAAAPDREVVEIEAGGKVVGSAVIEV